MHILSPETDNCPSWISGRERMTVENISWSISTKECCRPRRGLNPRPPGLQSDGASNWATEAGIDSSKYHLTILVLKFEIAHSTTFWCACMPNRVDPEQMSCHLIWVYTVCIGLSVQILILKMLLRYVVSDSFKLSCAGLPMSTHNTGFCGKTNKISIFSDCTTCLIILQL